MSFPTALCSARNAPREAWASWGVFMEQGGQEGKGGLCSSRLQALAALGSGLGLLGSWAVNPEPPWLSQGRVIY